VTAGIYFAAFYRPGPVEVQDNFEKGFSRCGIGKWRERTRPGLCRIPGGRATKWQSFPWIATIPSFTHAKRVEMGLGCVKLGEAYRYAFETCLPNDYPSDVAGDNIAQWHDMQTLSSVNPGEVRLSS